MLLWSALEHGQTKSYDQAYHALEDLLSQEGNEEIASHFKYPWHSRHEARYLSASDRSKEHHEFAAT